MLMQLLLFKDVRQKATFRTLNLETYESKSFSNDSLKFGAFYCSYFDRYIFLAETSPNPKIFVLDYDLKHIKTIENVAQLEINKLEYDYFSKQLFIFCNCPEYEIKIYDLQEDKLLLIEEKLDSQKIQKIIINPFQSKQIIILRENQIEINNLIYSQKLSKNQQELISYYKNQNSKITLKDINLNEESKITDVYILKQNCLLISTTFGNLIYYNMQNQEVLKNIELNFNEINKIFLNNKFLILLCDQKNFVSYELSENLEILSLDVVYEQSFDFGLMQNIFLNVIHEQFIITTENNVLYQGILPNDRDTDSKDLKDEEQDNKDCNEITFKYIFSYHTSEIILTFFKDQTNSVFTLDKSGVLLGWNLQEEIPLLKFQLTEQEICSAQKYQNDKIIIGTKNGILKILQITNDYQFNIVYQMKYFQGQSINRIRIVENLIIFEGQNKIFIGQFQENNFTYFGYVNYPEYEVIDLNCFYQQDFLQIYMLLETRIIQQFQISKDKLKSSENIEEIKDCEIFARRIDGDINNIITNQEQKFIYTNGDDQILKIYQKPKSRLIDIQNDTNLKNPIKEIIVNDSQCLDLRLQNDNLYIVTEIGELIRYNISIQSIQKIKISGTDEFQISSFEIQENYGLIFIGLKNGGVNIVKLNDLQIDQELLKIPFSIRNVENEEIKIFFDNQIDDFDEIQQKIFKEKIKEEKKLVNEKILNELKNLQNNFQELFEENQSQNQLKKLNYEEFCIDLEKKEKLHNDMENKTQNIQQKAINKICKNNMIHERIKNKTFDLMETHFKTITALSKKILITNFQIPKKNNKETQILKKIKFLRLLDLKEKQYLHEENQQYTFFNQRQFVQENCDFVINSTSEKPELILVDYEARAQAIKEYIEEQRKKREDANNDKNALRTQKKKFEMKNRRQRKVKRMQLGNPLVNLDKKTNQQNRNQTDGINGENKEEQEWNYIYSQVEIFSRFKRINQIYFLRNITRFIKQEFNQQFEQILLLRAKKIDLIDENNKKINEIYEELKEQNQIFIPYKNIIKDVNELLHLQSFEINFSKYLSKKERKRIEQEKLKEQERLQAINSDDANIRALKMMMNNTLEEKKENILQQQAEKEDWMDKPKEEMNEEERIKYNHYLEKQQQLKDEAEKLRKMYMQELKKINNQNKEIINDFDNQISILFMEKLEYIYRVYEQELIILKLKKNTYRDDLYQQELQIAQEEINNMENQLQSNQQLLENLKFVKNSQEQNKINKENELQKFDNKLTKQLWQYFFPQKEDSKRNKDTVYKIREIKGIDLELSLYPYNEIFNKYIIEKYKYNEEIYEQDVKEFLKKKGDDELVQQEKIKFFNFVKMKKNFNKQLKNFNQIDKIYTQEENIYQNLILKKQELENFIKLQTQEFQQNKIDVFFMIRLPSEKIEIQTMKVIPLLNDIILVDRDDIEELNKEIIHLGKEKLDYLKKNLEEKQKVEADLIDLKIVKKEIKEAMIESTILARLKVSKKLQQLLTKKDENLVELEEKYAKKQIEKLISSSEKSLLQINKKKKLMKKEIKFLTNENENLLLQGGTIQDSVNQRKEIFMMIFNKNPEEIFQEESSDNKKKGDYKKDEVGFMKAMQLSKNRKLFDIAKKLAHEIESMMIELKTLKDRTYPNLQRY